MRAFSLDSELLQSQYFFTFFFLITFFDPERTKKISYLMSKIAEINWHCVLKVSFHEKNGIVKKCNQVIQSFSPSGHQFRSIWGGKLHRAVVVAGLPGPSEKWAGGPRGGFVVTTLISDTQGPILPGITIPTEAQRFGPRVLSRSCVSLCSQVYILKW